MREKYWDLPLRMNQNKGSACPFHLDSTNDVTHCFCLVYLERYLKVNSKMLLGLRPSSLLFALSYSPLLGCHSSWFQFFSQAPSSLLLSSLSSVGTGVVLLVWDSS